MSVHCKLGDIQSIVSYSFDNSKTEVVTIKNAPIEVLVYENKQPRSNNCIEGDFGWYSIIYWEGGGTVYDARKIGNGEAIYMSNENSNTIYTNGSRCGYENKGIERFKNGVFDSCQIGYDSSPRINNVTFFYCGKDACELQIKYQNKLIYSLAGICPIEYKVVCGEECPNGYLKCQSNNYPGYCCLPCSEIAGEIKAIANQVRRINNG